MLQSRAVAFLIVLGISATASGCAGDESRPPPVSKASSPTDILELAAEADGAGSDSITISGTTNLPDGALLNIHADRVSTWVSESVERFFTVGIGSASVESGTFEAEVALDDRSFVDFEKVSGEVISRLDARVEVTVTFDPSNSMQPDDVVTQVGGARGSFLASSEQLSVFGSETDSPINQLEVVFREEVPFAYLDELPGNPLIVNSTDDSVREASEAAGDQELAKKAVVAAAGGIFAWQLHFSRPLRSVGPLYRLARVGGKRLPPEVTLALPYPASDTLGPWCVEAEVNGVVWYYLYDDPDHSYFGRPEGKHSGECPAPK